MAEGKDGGDGLTSPFGNGAGAPEATGPATKANDFTTNPNGNGRLAGGRDFVAEGNRPQKGRADGFNPDSVPAGGRLPFADPKSRAEATLQTVGGGRKPFRLNGGEGGGASSGPSPMKLSGGPAEAGSIPEDGAEG